MTPALSPDFIHQAEMGFTHRELLNGLPSAAAPYQVKKQSDGVYRLHRADEPSHEADHEAILRPHVVLTLQPEISRCIAAITLPVTATKLEFFGFSQAEFDAFMRRYKRYLHKGGG